MDKLTSNVLKNLKQLAVNVRYDTTSAVAASAVSILEDRSGDYILTDQLNFSELNAQLHKEPLPLSAFQKAFYKSGSAIFGGEVAALTLNDWFFRLGHPSCASGGVLFREWLETNQVSWFEVQNKVYIAPTDIANYGFGFLLGIGKSFSYDLVKGIYDLGEVGLKLESLVRKTSVDFAVELYQEFAKTGAPSKTESLLNKLNQDILNSFDPTRYGSSYGILPAVSSFLNSLKDILLELCAAPLIQIKNSREKLMTLIDEFYYKLTKADEDTPAGDANSDALIIWGKLKKYITGYFPEILKRQDELLFKFEFFKAGLLIGNEICNIAQIAAGLILSLWKLGKLGKLYLTSLAPKARAILLSAFISFSAMDARAIAAIPMLSAAGPSAALTIGKELNRVRNISSLSIAEQFPGFALINLNEAVVLAPRGTIAAIQKMTDNAGTNMILLGLFTAAAGMVAGILVKKKPDEDELVVSFDIYDDRFRFVWNSLILSGKKPALQDIIKSLAGGSVKASNIAEVTSYAQRSADKFLKTPDAKIIFKKYPAYKANAKERGNLLSNLSVKFNYHLSNELRALLKPQRGKFIILIDETFGSLASGVLNRKKSITRIVQGKKVTKDIGEILDMTKREFLETYRPQDFKKGYFDDLSDKLKLLKSKKLNALYDDLLKKEAVLKKQGKTFDEIADELETLTEDFAAELAKHPEAKNILTEYIGKVRIDGFVKDARPDFMVTSLLEGNYVFDFIHGQSSKSHLTGTKFYHTVSEVLFGATIEHEVVDIIYKFKI
ncbi:hypothetical protein GZH53_19385 [Flavihumibacter sp. R14]|nr:hypothetical protein [Flavihumibacter soli]